MRVFRTISGKCTSANGYSRYNRNDRVVHLQSGYKAENAPFGHRVMKDFFGCGKYIDSKGYLRYTQNDKLVHREVAERMLGRKLRPEEVVHHIDRDKTNNAPSNLWVFPSQAEHDRVHEMDAEKYGWAASYCGPIKIMPVPEMVWRAEPPAVDSKVFRGIRHRPPLEMFASIIFWAAIICFWANSYWDKDETYHGRIDRSIEQKIKIQQVGSKPRQPKHSKRKRHAYLIGGVKATR